MINQIMIKYYKKKKKKKKKKIKLKIWKFHY